MENKMNRNRNLKSVILIAVMALGVSFLAEILATKKRADRFFAENICLHWLLEIARGVNEFEDTYGQMPSVVPYVFICKMEDGGFIEPGMLNCPIGAYRGEDIAKGSYQIAKMPENELGLAFIARCRYHNCYVYRRKNDKTMRLAGNLPLNEGIPWYNPFKKSQEFIDSLNLLCDSPGINWLPCDTNSYPSITDWSEEAASRWINAQKTNEYSHQHSP